MPKFEIRIIEYLTKTITTEAKDEKEAFLKIRDGWLNEKYVLNADNFYDVNFEVRHVNEINGEFTIHKYGKKGNNLPPAVI